MLIFLEILFIILFIILVLTILITFWTKREKIFFIDVVENNKRIIKSVKLLPIIKPEWEKNLVKKIQKQKRKMATKKDLFSFGGKYGLQDNLIRQIIFIISSDFFGNEQIFCLQNNKILSCTYYNLLEVLETKKLLGNSFLTNFYFLTTKDKENCLIKFIILRHRLIFKIKSILAY